jgi:phosphopantothenoylcysteine decarboxylase/phosphopantothenate--cysteine ligase
MLRGAQVTLVTAPTSIEKPPFVDVVPVVSAQEMYEAIRERIDEQDVLIMAAAVADYRPSKVSDQKIKKHDGDAVLELERTTDIIATLAQNKKPKQFFCGFSMETDNVLENSKAKLEKKNLDMVAANSLRVSGAGFGVDTNVVTLITKDSVIELSLLSKDETAQELLDEIRRRLKRQ